MTARAWPSGRPVEVPGPDGVYGWEEFQSNGLLWLFNATVLHPRGFALGLAQLGGQMVGWKLLGDGTEPWVFRDCDVDDEFAAVNRLLKPGPA